MTVQYNGLFFGQTFVIVIRKRQDVVVSSWRYLLCTRFDFRPYIYATHVALRCYICNTSLSIWFFSPFGVLAVVEEAAYAVKPHVLWYAVRNKLSKQTYLSSSQVPCIGRSCLFYYFLTRKIFMSALIYPAMPVFSSVKFGVWATVALLFLFSN